MGGLARRSRLGLVKKAPAVAVVWESRPRHGGLEHLSQRAIIGAPEGRWPARETRKVLGESSNIGRQTGVRWKETYLTVDSANPLGSLRREAFDEQVPGTGSGLACAS
jgi:hypothetical protein